MLRTVSPSISCIVRLYKQRLAPASAERRDQEFGKTARIAHDHPTFRERRRRSGHQDRLLIHHRPIAFRWNRRHVRKARFGKSPRQAARDIKA